MVITYLLIPVLVPGYRKTENIHFLQINTAFIQLRTRIQTDIKVEEKIYCQGQYWMFCQEQYIRCWRKMVFPILLSPCCAIMYYILLSKLVIKYFQYKYIHTVIPGLFIPTNILRYSVVLRTIFVTYWFLNHDNNSILRIRQMNQTGTFV